MSLEWLVFLVVVVRWVGVVVFEAFGMSKAQRERDGGESPC